MSKKRSRAYQKRDAPAQKVAFMCSDDAFRVLCGDGYRRLIDCPEVKMCARIYADLISSMTLHLMQDTDAGDVRIKNALSRKMDIEPSHNMTRKAWMYNIVNTMVLYGNQFTLPVVDNDGLLSDMIPLIPSRVSVIDNGMDYMIRYGDMTFASDQLLHFVANPDPDRPYMGEGFNASLKDVVAGLRQANATKKALMESPAPSLIVKVDGLTEEFSSPEGRRRLLDDYIDKSDNGRPWMIPAEAFSIEQVKPLTLTDLAISDSMSIDKRTVAAIFGVPPYMVGIGEFKKEEYNAFVRTRVMPLAKAIEQELTKKTLYSPELFWRFNSRSLYSYDLNELIQAGGEMVDRMAMRRNEWRDWVGMTPDADMNELLALENYIPAEMLGQQKKLKDGNGGGESNEE